MLLEYNLGCKLFSNTTNTMLLTPRGSIFLKYSERILSLCEESCRSLIKNEQIPCPKLRIGITQTLAVYLFPKLLRFCSQQSIHAHVKILIGTNEQIAQEIISSKLDIALVTKEMFEFLKKRFKVKIKCLLPSSLNFILSPCHQFAKRKFLRKSELYNLSYLNLISSSLTSMDLYQLLKVHQVDIYQFKTIICVGSLESLQIAINLGLGTTIFPSMTLVSKKKFKIITIKEAKMAQQFFLISSTKYKKIPYFKFFLANLTNPIFAIEDVLADKKVDGLKKNKVL